MSSSAVFAAAQVISAMMSIPTTRTSIARTFGAIPALAVEAAMTALCCAGATARAMPPCAVYGRR